MDSSFPSVYAPVEETIYEFVEPRHDIVFGHYEFVVARFDVVVRHYEFVVALFEFVVALFEFVVADYEFRIGETGRSVLRAVYNLRHERDRAEVAGKWLGPMKAEAEP
jgi:hypothetical protein